MHFGRAIRSLCKKSAPQPVSEGQILISKPQNAKSRQIDEILELFILVCREVTGTASRRKNGFAFSIAGIIASFSLSKDRVRQIFVLEWRCPECAVDYFVDQL